MFRWLAFFVVVIAASVAAFFVFYHPPMRLMPAPLLFQDGSDRLFDLAPALADGSEISIFYATNRLPIGPRDNRIYTVAPDRRLHVGAADLRIGDEGSTLDQIREWTMSGDPDDRPFIHLERMREAGTLSDPKEGPDAKVTAWLDEINAELARSRDPDILVYVHGANTTVERAAGQASQLHHFLGRDSVVVLYAWPTAENFLRYPSDIETAFGAAPHLAELIDLLAEHTDAEHVNVFTYSAGATVGSDALARVAENYPVAADRLGEVYHAAPDADFRGFVEDMRVYGPHARRVTTAVNLGDSALRLSGIVNRASRAGRPDLAELSPEATDWLLTAARDQGLEILRVRPDDMPGLAATSHTFWYDDPWVSNDVLVKLIFHPRPDERGLIEDTAPSGAHYWTFPKDYPERIRELRRNFLSHLPSGTPDASPAAP
ncbi:MAG: alpha/beta hydrolase [Amaricoccus sp.]|uniref:alpha/beta hydrolase n=1 Tax=Amaricoccus sp. TaxID=1872485 RepID=UPI003314DA23